MLWLGALHVNLWHCTHDAACASVVITSKGSLDVLPTALTHLKLLRDLAVENGVSVGTHPIVSAAAVRQLAVGGYLCGVVVQVTTGYGVPCKLALKYGVRGVQHKHTAVRTAAMALLVALHSFAPDEVKRLLRAYPNLPVQVKTVRHPRPCSAVPHCHASPHAVM